VGTKQNPEEKFDEAALRELCQELYLDLEKQAQMWQMFKLWIKKREVIFNQFHIVHDDDEAGNVCAESRIFGMYVPWDDAEMIQKFRMPCREKWWMGQFKNPDMSTETQGWILVPSHVMQPEHDKLRVECQEDNIVETLPFRHESMYKPNFIRAMNAFLQVARAQVAQARR